jgi:hypothetical protein
MYGSRVGVVWNHKPEMGDPSTTHASNDMEQDGLQR